MWIVRVALNRPYTFVVMALLLLIIGPIIISRTPKDIFPEIDIPVITVIWQYTGLNPEEMANRIVSNYERTLTTVVNDIEHIESQSLNGISIVKVFFHPGAKVDLAMSQITSASQSAVRQAPPGAAPPFIIVYNASSVPILQLSMSGKDMSEQQLADIGQNFLRTQLATIQGASLPNPYGGRQRQIQVDLDLQSMQQKGLDAAAIVNAVGEQNLILPAGTAKIGNFEYDVDLNSSPRTVEEINDLPIRTVGGSTIFLRDVAHVRDGYPPQRNIVRVDGQRSALLTVQKTGSSSTLDIIDGVKRELRRAESALPSGLEIRSLADQSLFVRAAIQGVLREAIIAACLTSIMILIFLGSWRSTLIIAVSIPLSILTSIIVLSALGQTINIMTLGGLALAVGILVDDATVEIENIDRNLNEGKETEKAILDGASQIAAPAFVSTLSICIVFVPMFFLTGVSRYLFVPLAEAVVFAMLASYILSRTLVPTMAKYLLKEHHGHHAGRRSRNPFTLVQNAFERVFESVRAGYRGLLQRCITHRAIFAACFVLACVASFALLPWVGQDFFPNVDSGQFKLHLRAATGTRIEETAALCDRIDEVIRETIPPKELGPVIDNIGLPNSGLNLSYSISAPIGSEDADILVSLNEGHRPTEDYVHELRTRLNDAFPGVMFYFLPADIVSQILNFGLPAPIDVQVVGANVGANREFAAQLLRKLKTVPGTADLRIQQPFNHPKLHLTVDRTKAGEGGFTEKDVASSLLVSLSGSFQTTPTYWLDPRNGVQYALATQAPQYQLDSLQGLANIPVAAGNGRSGRPEILGDLATISRGAGMGIVSHYNVQPVIDIFGSVQRRDLGSVAREIMPIVDASRKDLPRGSQLVVRGQIDTMQSSFLGLLGGLLLAIVLDYFLIVVNFQSWLDPFIIIAALPAALAGIVWMLFMTHTTLSVPALTGSIMCMGVATANSILVVSFAKDRMLEGSSAGAAALEAGFTRFRPVLMTALAMIIGMVPMALGLGEGGEQNAPLGRAVIGGLMFATVATLFFVPAIFSLFHNRQVASIEPAIDAETDGV